MTSGTTPLEFDAGEIDCKTDEFEEKLCVAWRSKMCAGEEGNSCNSPEGRKEAQGAPLRQAVFSSSRPPVTRLKTSRVRVRARDLCLFQVEVHKL